MSIQGPREPYPRDMKGYGRAIPDPKWPGGAYVAVQFVLNYEEGGENNILHGDAASEAFLVDVIGAAPWPGKRHWNVESMYEYGARAGFWRLHRLFTGLKLPVIVGEKGLHGVHLTISGTPGHGSQPFKTDNALVTAAEVFCSQCGTKNGPAAKFCSSCGTTLNATVS